MALANTPNLDLLRVQETWQFADEAFNKVIDDADNKLVGVAHLKSPKHWTDWQANTDYAKDDVVRITNTKSHQYYQCIVGGTSGAVEPTNNVTDSMVTDGTVEWRVVSLSEAGIGGGVIQIWLSGWHYLRGDAVLYGTALYRCKIDHDAKDWNTDYIYWQEVYASIRAWQPLIYYFANDVAIYDDLIYKCITAHKSATTFSATEEANWEMIGGAGGAKDWESGKKYLAGSLVTVNGILYKSNSKHTSGTSFSADISNWEIVYSNIRAWKVNEYYPTGTLISYDNIMYKCLTAHTAGTNFNTDLSNWELFHNPIAIWAPNKAYNAGQLVIYTGVEKDSRVYRCLEKHESSATFDLDFDKWRAISASIATWDYNTAYKSGDIILYNEQLFYCVANHVSNPDPTDTSGIYADISEILADTKWIQVKNDIALVKEWVTNWVYEKNQLVTHNNKLYRCNTKHKSNSFDTDIEKWDVIYSSLPEWEAEETYKAGEVVIYKNKLYKCRTTNSDAVWLGSKWTFLESVDTWEPLEYYPFHTLAVNDGILYRCVDPHTSTSLFDTTKWEALSGTGGGGGGGIGYSQVEAAVLSASETSPYVVNISIANNPTHTLPPIDVLRRKEGIYSTEPVIEFESSDASKFSYNTKFIGFKDSAMQVIQKVEYSLSDASMLGAGYIRISEPIDLSVFVNLLGMVVENV